MRGAVIYAPRDIRDDPELIHPTDAIIRLSATCVCGSDLWRYRGIEAVDRPTPMGHEYVGVVEQAGREVRNIKLPLSEAAEGYRAMDERRAVKPLLRL